MAASAELSDQAIREAEPVLMAFAVRAVRREEVARDLVQDTFVAAIENRASFQGRSKLRTWLVGILSRKIVDHFRKTRREVLTDIPPEPDSPSRFAPAPENPPEARLDHRKALKVVESAMGALSELERLAVLLCDVEQADRKDACNMMGVQPTHLRVLLHRGRHKLRKALEDAELRPGST
ncbi:MAG: RNA polymerase sigma factor [Myxococcota bacterium]